MILGQTEKRFKCEVGQDESEPTAEEVLQTLTTYGLGEEGCNNYAAALEKFETNDQICYDAVTNEDIHNESVRVPTKYL